MSVLSDSWYRVAALRPRLRSHARLHRHVERGEPSYVLLDPATQRTHRFGPAARLLIGLMDGHRSVDELWSIASRRLGDAGPTQDEVIELLGQLHRADLLQGDALPDAAEVAERGAQQRSSKRRQSWLNPLALRLPLWDPDRALDRATPWLRPLWGRAGALAWLGAVLSVLFMLPAHWSELHGHVSDHVLASDNLLPLALVFVLLKAAHELGHAVAVKRGGGEVHEMGLMLLVLMPVPYVDAGASVAFRSRRDRALVGAAGMVVELFLAALAFHAWRLVEPGLVRSLLFNVMLVAGVSTLVFNGNPLLRYDAYYVLADLAGLPNLATRATRWWAWLVQRHAFGLRDAVNPARNGREALWYAAYGLASYVYRWFVTVAIALYVGGQFFIVGTLMGLWALASMGLWPLLRALKWLHGPAAGPQRMRARAVTATALAVLGLLAFAVPAPHSTVAEGVVWLPEQALVRASEDGVLAGMDARPGASVQAGQLLMHLADPVLEARLAQSRARVAELRLAYHAQLGTDRAAAQAALQPWRQEAAVLADLEERQRRLAVRAPASGTLVLARADDLPGRRVRQGDVLAHVQDGQAPLVRVVLTQDAAERVAEANRGVQVRLAHAPGQVLTAQVARAVPQADRRLPSRALSAGAGGTQSTDPRDPDGLRTLERVFQLDVRLPADSQPAGYGERAVVRFTHPPQAIGLQLLDALRRLLLGRFTV